MDVPVQFFQSVIAVELAVTGALLWQIRFFESSDAARRDTDGLPDARLRLGMAIVLGATVFGSLWAIADEGPKWAALAVTVGLAISLVPILLRVLPPLAKDAATNKRDAGYAVTVLGLMATWSWSRAFSSCSTSRRRRPFARTCESPELSTDCGLNCGKC